jgi:tRNA(adenine34) deaminase
MLTIYSDEHFMNLALKEAQIGLEKGEVPVGAVIVSNNQVIAKSHNSVELLHDVTAHAEVLALTAAAQSLGSKYLIDCTLYVTLEPCVMCAGALRWAQLDRLVYGASDDSAGFMRYGKSLLHAKTKVEFGILHDPCSEIIKNFFREKRKTGI